MCLLPLSKANRANVSQHVVTAAKCPLREEDEMAAVRDCKPPTLATRARLVLFHRTNRPSACAWWHKSRPFDLEMFRQSCSNWKVAVVWWCAVGVVWLVVVDMLWVVLVCPLVGAGVGVGWFVAQVCGCCCCCWLCVG